MNFRFVVRIVYIERRGELVLFVMRISSFSVLDVIINYFFKMVLKSSIVSGFFRSVLII